VSISITANRPLLPEKAVRKARSSSLFLLLQTNRPLHLLFVSHLVCNSGEDGDHGQKSVLGEILLVQTGNIRTEDEENAIVQENYSDAFAVVCNLPQIFAGCFFPPRRQSLPLVGFLRLIIARIGGRRTFPRDLFSGGENPKMSQLVSSGSMQNTLEFQHWYHQLSSVFGHEFTSNGSQCLSSNSTGLNSPPGEFRPMGIVEMALVPPCLVRENGKISSPRRRQKFDDAGAMGD